MEAFARAQTRLTERVVFGSLGQSTKKLRLAERAVFGSLGQGTKKLRLAKRSFSGSFGQSAKKHRIPNQLDNPALACYLVARLSFRSENA
jgi:hypothetical protein